MPEQSSLVPAHGDYHANQLLEIDGAARRDRLRRDVRRRCRPRPVELRGAPRERGRGGRDGRLGGARGPRRGVWPAARTRSRGTSPPRSSVARPSRSASWSPTGRCASSGWSPTPRRRCTCEHDTTARARSTTRSRRCRGCSTSTRWPRSSNARSAGTARSSRSRSATSATGRAAACWSATRSRSTVRRMASWRWPNPEAASRGAPRSRPTSSSPPRWRIAPLQPRRSPTRTISASSCSGRRSTWRCRRWPSRPSDSVRSSRTPACGPASRARCRSSCTSSRTAAAVLRYGEHFVKIYAEDKAYERAVAGMLAADALPMRSARLDAAIPELRLTAQSFVEGVPPGGPVEAAPAAGAFLAMLHGTPNDSVRSTPPAHRLESARVRAPARLDRAAARAAARGAAAPPRGADAGRAARALARRFPRTPDARARRRLRRHRLRRDLPCAGGARLRHVRVLAGTRSRRPPRGHGGGRRARRGLRAASARHSLVPDLRPAPPRLDPVPRLPRELAGTGRGTRALRRAALGA